MGAAPARGDVLALYRSLLRMAREFTDYNIREYAKRRTVDAFRQNSILSNPTEAASVFVDGKAHLDVAKRQAIVYSLYAPGVKNIMEIKNPPAP